MYFINITGNATVSRLTFDVGQKKDSFGISKKDNTCYISDNIFYTLVENEENRSLYTGKWCIEMDMEIELIRVTSATDHLLPRLLELYRESFPPEERRDEARLLDLLESPQMHYMAIIRENELTGFILYWDFYDFRFVEHFAIFDQFRNKSVGSRVLKLLRNNFPKLLLELEIPNDGLSERRLGFYTRNGFHVLNVDYAQPPYRKGETQLPMLLLSNFPDWEEKELARAIKLFHDKVYYSQY